MIARPPSRFPEEAIAMSDSSRLSRRSLGASLAAGAVFAPLAASSARADGAAPGLVRAENAKPGTRDWMLSKAEIDPATRYRSPRVEGFCSHASARAGDELSFFVSTSPVSPVTIAIYRLGYYGGDGGRLVADLGGFDGVVQPDPPIGPKRVRECAWTPTARVTVGPDWISGVYVAKLTATRSGHQSYSIFVVRDERPADYLLQASDFTWQAYNRWPDRFALYDDGEKEWYWGPGVQVSFRRPYGKYCQILDQPLSIGSGEWFLWEFPFAFWMESLGLDVTYCSNLDTHRDPAGLLRAKGFLSVGHDEYWTIEMFRNVQAAVQAGVSAGFFSGNAVCGRVLLDEAGPAFERVGVFGPPGGTHEFEQMSRLVHERPYANELVGAHSTGPVTGGADWVCTTPDHWIHAGTGMRLGDRIPGIVGWEWHGDPAPIPGLEVVATAPTESAPGKPNGGTWTATVYPGPRGNVVFNAGTCWWADGLAAPPGYVRPSVYTSPQGPDARIERITRNVLARMAGG